MKMIGVECPSCRVTDELAASCLLLEVGTAAEDDGSSQASWICDTCHEPVTLPIDLTVLVALVAAGATVLDSAQDDASPAPTGAHPENPIGGRAFTRDDLLQFHESLQDDSWLTAVLSRP
jgi:hypothetical protein